jgi:hypothetical protein
MVTSPADVPVGNGARRALLAAVAVTVALYVAPGGDVLARPLVWVATLAHELGHGAAAAAVGGDVVSVEVFADGSGVARSVRPPGRLRTAAVAAGGLVGPAFAAAALFALARRRRTARLAAGATGVALLGALPFALRGTLAVVLGVVLGVGLVALALRAPAAATQVAVVFFAVQLALSVFSDGDYLFTATAHTGAGVGPSDSAQIAEALIGPFWLWGAVCGLVSVAVLCIGLLTFLHAAARDRVKAA